MKINVWTSIRLGSCGTYVPETQSIKKYQLKVCLTRQGKLWKSSHDITYYYNAYSFDWFRIILPVTATITSISKEFVLR